jgi:hypothetical protein
VEFGLNNAGFLLKEAQERALATCKSRSFEHFVLIFAFMDVKRSLG